MLNGIRKRIGLSHWFTVFIRNFHVHVCVRGMDRDRGRD